MSTKIAAPTDSNFEQSFFQLAYDKLQEKLYNLLPFLVGFEVVNKSDDGTKALGVFGFKSNNGQILFVPAFFVDGSVKDLDLFYSKDNEQFYPLNEDWAELFLKDDTTGIGDVSRSSRQELQRDMPHVDFRNFVTPPRTGKTSFASVIDYVKDGDNITKKAFLQLMENEKYGADYTEALLRYYPIEKIAEALTPKKIDVPNTARTVPVEVVRKADKEKSKNLTDEQKSSLLSNGYVIIDNRTEDKKAHVGIFKFQEKFQNPDKSGFYSYLTRQGQLRYGLILNNPISLRMGFPSDESIVIDMDSKDKGYAYRVCPSTVFIKDHIELPNFKEVVDMMVDAGEGEPSFSNQYILINERLKCTAPFRISQNFKDSNGVRRIVADIIGSVDHSLPKGFNSYNRVANKTEVDEGYDSEMRKVTLVFTKKNSDTVEFRNNIIYIPKGFKLLKINTYGKDDFDNNRPGGLATLNGALSDKNVFPFTLRVNGSEYYSSVGAAKKHYATAMDAKIGMVIEYGLGEKEANDLVDTLVQGITKEGHIKLAYTGDETLSLQSEQPNTNIMGQPEFHGVPYQESVGNSDGYTGDPTRLGMADTAGPNLEGIDGEVQQAIDMSNGGQKEIFDTQSIATLAKYVNPGDKASQYMPDFVTTLDKLGRMLFLIYWETDKFKEMYGRDELPELIELLKNVFKNLGDLIIFLKHKFPDLSINSNEQAVETI